LKLRCALCGQARGEIGSHLHQDIESDDVNRAKRCTFGTPDRRPRDGVNLLDRIRGVCQRFKYTDETMRGHVIGNETWDISRQDDVLAEAAIGEVRDGGDDPLIRFGRRNDFEQWEISRRVEKVRAEPATPEVNAASGGETGQGKAGRVRADDRSRPSRGVDAFKERSLGISVFDDRFDDPISFCNSA